MLLLCFLCVYVFKGGGGYFIYLKIVHSGYIFYRFYKFVLPFFHIETKKWSAYMINSSIESSNFLFWQE